MNMQISKVGARLLLVAVIFYSCKKETTTPEPSPVAVDHSQDSVNLVAAGKGFKKVFGYLEPRGVLYFPGTINEIHGLDLTVEGNDKVNFAFYKSNGSQQGDVKTVFRATANIMTQSVVAAPVSFTFTKPSGSSWQELGYQYAPYSNKLAYMYYSYSGPGYVSGDITESTGQSILTTDRRIGKSGHSIYHIVGGQGAGSAVSTNNFTYGYYNSAGNFVQFSSSDGTFTGIQFGLRPSSLYRGLFEPIPATNEGIVVLYNADSVNVYLNNLAIPAVKFTRVGKVVLTTKMTMTGNTIIKNNANDADFSFACIEGSTVWTFLFNTSTKTITKVLDGATLPTGAKFIDLDENGNLYYVVNNSIFKHSLSAGSSSLAQDVLSNGTISALKYYNGKVFVLAERFKNADGSQGRRQLDVLMQE
jgi:hypothetical protein